MAVAGAIAIDPAQIRAAFAARGVLALHYAASVVDACRFLRAGALLAPGDIFLDAVDIHAREARANKCGPVLFVIASAVLATPAARDAGVSKCGPSARAGRAAQECWFADAGEVERDFVIGDHGQMLVLRSGGVLPLGGCLSRVIVDAAALDAAAQQALRAAMREGGLEAPLERRVCMPACACGAHGINTFLA